MLVENRQITNALTVDLEDWYQGLTRTMYTPELWKVLPARIEDSTTLLLGLLEETGTKATFFVLGYLAQQYPKLIKKIADAGHELGSHGFSHQPIHRLTPRQLEDELIKTKEVIQQNASIPVDGFRAPQFSINTRTLWALPIIANVGYIYDSSVFPARSLLYGYPQAKRIPFKPLPNHDLVEYPAATIVLGGVSVPVAGGVYNRFWPYPFIRWAIAKLNRQGIPAIIYIHPWELDLEQPRISVNLRERVTHYGMRKTIARKLHQLLSSFRFAPLREVHKEWLSKN